MFQTTPYTQISKCKVMEVAKSSSKLFHSCLSNHQNPLILALNSINTPGNPTRRFKRNWYDMI